MITLYTSHVEEKYTLDDHRRNKSTFFLSLPHNLTHEKAGREKILPASLLETQIILHSRHIHSSSSSLLLTGVDLLPVPLHVAERGEYLAADGALRHALVHLDVVDAGVAGLEHLAADLARQVLAVVAGVWNLMRIC